MGGAIPLDFLFWGAAFSAYFCVMTFIWSNFVSELATSPVTEWVGVFTGLLCVWLAARNIIWNWPFAVVNVLIYLLLFLEKKLYADSALQIYLLATNIYGWYYWSSNKQAKATPIVVLKTKSLLWYSLTVFAFTVAVGWLLSENTQAALPYLDSFCTACSLVAQFLLARRVLQNWLIWLFVDIIYVGIYVAKGLTPTAWMYAFYAAIALKGFFDWKKIYREQES